MRSQIYGILGLMYTLAIGILLVVALVGTSKQFTWQSSAPLYRFALGMISSNIEKVKTFISQERAYAVDRASFYTGAFGGFSTFHDLVPKTSASICGCPNGYSPSSDNDQYCEKDGDKVPANSCFIYNGKKLDVLVLNKTFWYISPEKYVVYWYNGTSEIPDENKVANTTEGYMNNLFPIPDPRIIIPLQILGVNMKFRYVTEIKNFSNDYIDVDWIPTGMDTIVINYPPMNPFLSYMTKLLVSSHVKNNLFGLYSVSKKFAEHHSAFLSNVSNGILPTIIDEVYVKNYTDELGNVHHCNYTADVDYPKNEKFECDSNIKINKLGPLRALIFYVDEHYWDSNSGSDFYIGKMGASCGSCKKPDYLSLNENTLENELPCTAEIKPYIENPTTNSRMTFIKFNITKFYGCNNDDNLTCMMCAIVSYLNKEVSGTEIQESNGYWYFNNSLTNDNYSIKILPAESFNLTLNGASKVPYDWNNETFSVWITPPYNYKMNGQNCSNIENGGKAGADSICEMYGFWNATGCQSLHGICSIWSYNITKGPELSTSNSNYHRITELKCGNDEKYINDSNGNKFSVLGKISTGGTFTVNRLTLEKLVNSSTWNMIKNLDWACKAEEENSSSEVEKYTITFGNSENGYLIGDISTMSIVGDTGEPYSYHAQKINCSGNVYDIGFNWTVYTNQTGWRSDFGNLSGGKTWAKWFCKTKGEDEATGFYVNKSSGRDPALNLSMTTSATGNAKITKVTCNTSWGAEDITLGESDSHIYIKGDEPLVFNLYWIPFKDVNIYQPPGYSNQTEILKRICGGSIDSVHFNDSGPTPHLIWDVGKEGSSSTSGNCLTKIRCLMR